MSRSQIHAVNAFARVGSLALVSSLLVFSACSASKLDSPSNSDAGQDASPSSGCTPSQTGCTRARWPRLVLAYGDKAASTFKYRFSVSGNEYPSDTHCPAGYGESATLHCDRSYDSSPGEHVVTIEISRPEAGVPVLTRDVALTPFNYCGEGMVQLVVTQDDAGQPHLSEPQQINACGL